MKYNYIYLLQMPPFKNNKSFKIYDKKTHPLNCEIHLFMNQHKSTPHNSKLNTFCKIENIKNKSFHKFLQENTLSYTSPCHFKVKLNFLLSNI